jgi:hypothetical protein
MNLSRPRTERRARLVFVLHINFLQHYAPPFCKRKVNETGLESVTNRAPYKPSVMLRWGGIAMRVGQSIVLDKETQPVYARERDPQWPGGR